MGKRVGDVTIASYEDAERILGRAESVTVCNNTVLKRVPRVDGPEYWVLLHGHSIVKYRRTGEVLLQDGGWRTVTTRSRLNLFSPVRVVQRDFTWYVIGGGREGDGMPAGSEVFFYSGMNVGEGGVFA